VTVSLRRSFAITRNELRLLRRDPTPLVILIAMPLLIVPILRATCRAVLVVSGHPHASGSDFAVPGQAVSFIFFLAPTIAFTFFREHGWRTWARLRASCGNSAEILLGKALPMLAVGALQLALLFGVGVAVLDLHVPGSAVGVALLCLALLLCVVALGLALTAVFRTMQQLNAFGYLGATFFGMLGGAFVPLAMLPSWARAVAPATPQYWAMRGLRSLILDGKGTSAVGLPVAVLCGYALLFVIIALWRLRFDDAKVGWA